MDNGGFRLSVGSNVKAGGAQAASRYISRRDKYAEQGGYEYGGVAGWEEGAESLWEAAEAAERPKSTRKPRRVEDPSKQRERTVARRLELNTPHTLSPRQKAELVAGFATWLNQETGCAVEWATHTAPRASDNDHAHLLMTDRLAENGKLGEKKRDLGRYAESGPQIAAWRAEWCERCNAAIRANPSKDDELKQPLMDHRTNAAIAEERGLVPLAPKPYIPRAIFQRALKRGEAVGKAGPVFTEEDGEHFRKINVWEKVRRIAIKARELAGFADRDAKEAVEAGKALAEKQRQKDEWDAAIRENARSLGPLSGKAIKPNARRSPVR